MHRRTSDNDTAYTDFAKVMTPRLVRTALLMCGDWHLVEDLVQTTLAKVYAGWGKVRRADVPEASARGTLTKTFLSHQRLGSYRLRLLVGDQGRRAAAGAAHAAELGRSCQGAVGAFALTSP